MDLNAWILAFLSLTLLIQFVFYLPLLREKKKLENEFVDIHSDIMTRPRFEKILTNELRRGARYHYPVTLCYLDLDDFESVREKIGRKESEKVMEQFCQILKKNTRCADGAAHFQKEEFWVLLPHTDTVRSKKFLTRLQNETEAHLGIGFSAGVSSFQAGENPAQLIMRARTALIQAKGEGGRQVRHGANEVPAALPL
jgi:diguanylate cyclase